MYNKDEVNYYFVFKTLRTLFYDYTRKVSRRANYSEKASKSLSEDYIYDLIDVEIKEQHLKEVLERLHWYDKKVFDLVYKENISMLQLSEMTGISYYSIYRTIQKVKRTIKKNICD